MSEPVFGVHGAFRARVFAAFLGFLSCAAPYAFAPDDRPPLRGIKLPAEVLEKIYVIS